MTRSAILLLIASFNGFLSVSLSDGSPVCSSGIPPPVVYATRGYNAAGHPASGIHHIYNGSARTLLSTDGSFAALDYWNAGEVLAWSDEVRSQIHICRVSEAETLVDGISLCNGSEPEFVEHQRGSVDGLAIDWVHALLFHTLQPWNGYHHKEGKICVVDLRTMQDRVLISKDVRAPRALAVDPSLGVIFWTDIVVGRIDRAGMDGRQRVTFPDRYGDYRPRFPNGLALDMAERRVYWLEKGDPRGIYSADYNGANFRAVLRSSHMVSPFALAITADWLLWTDWRRMGVCASSRCSNETVQLGKVVDDTRTMAETQAMTVRAFDPSTQPRVENVCEANTCRCEEFCLPTSRLEVDGNGSDGEQRPAHLYVCLTENGTRLLPTPPPAQGTHYGAWTAISTLLNVLLLLAVIALLVWGPPAWIQRHIASYRHGGHGLLDETRSDTDSSHFELGECVNRQ